MKTERSLSGFRPSSKVLYMYTIDMKKLSKNVKSAIKTGNTLEDVFALMLEENVGLLENKQLNLYTTNDFNAIAQYIKESKPKSAAEQEASEKREALGDKMIFFTTYYFIVSSLIAFQIWI
jgi:hypothetical protein